MNWLLVLLALIPEPRIETFWPTSALGWLTTISVVVALSKMAYDKVTGRALTLKGIGDSLATLSREMTGVNTRLAALEQVDESTEKMLRNLDWELRGPDGTNGIKAKVEKCLTETEKINASLRRSAILSARFREILRHWQGPERRRDMRGLKELLEDADRGDEREESEE